MTYWMHYFVNFIFITRWWLCKLQVTKYPVILLPQEKIVDTNGAGMFFTNQSHPANPKKEPIKKKEKEQNN